MKLRDLIDKIGQWIIDNPSKALVILVVIAAFTLGWILG